MSYKKNITLWREQKQIPEIRNRLGCYQRISPRLNKAKLIFMLAQQVQVGKLLQRISQKARFITELQLQGNNLSACTINLLIRIEWKFICYINISKSNLTDNALSHLPQLNWPFLKQLNLSFNPIKNKAIEYVCRCQFPRLEQLLLKNTNITSSCFRNIAKAQWRLKYLSLCQCDIGYLDLSFVRNLVWQQGCLMDLHTRYSQYSFVWSNPLAKLPHCMSEIKILVNSNNTVINPASSVANLRKMYPNANTLFFVWSANQNVAHNDDNDDDSNDDYP